MDEICRLCLTVSEEMAHKLCDEFIKSLLLSSLNIQVQLNAAFPSFICCLCAKALEDFYNFKEKVKQNELKLTKLYNSGINLESFYWTLKSKNISIDNIKSEIENEDEDHFCNEPVHGEFELESNKHFTTKSENNIEDIPQKSLNINTVTEENITGTQLEKLNRKRKIQSQKLIKTTMKRNRKIKTIKNNIVIDSTINDDTLKINTAKMQSTNETKTESNNIKFVTKKEILAEINTMEHKCLTCFEYIISNSELIKHYKTVHNTSNTDSVANEKPKSIENNSVEILKDLSCNDNVDTALQKSESLYNCRVCGRTFTSVYAIVRHGRVHEAGTRYCSHGCGYTTVYSGALRDHEKRHKNNFKFKCATCGAGFHAKTWHDQHQNIHNNVKPFVCDVCGMAFHMHRYLTSHRTSVHANVSKGSKKYICPHCDLLFFNIHSYKTHLEEHIGKKGYLCDLCGKVCASAEQLKYHNNAHLGVKPYICSICNKKFAKKFNLTVHEKAHSGEKHLCQTCGKYFAQRSTLLRHSRRRHPEITEQNHGKSKNVLSLGNP